MLFQDNTKKEAYIFLVSKRNREFKSLRLYIFIIKVRTNQEISKLIEDFILYRYRSNQTS